MTEQPPPAADTSPSAAVLSRHQLNQTVRRRTTVVLVACLAVLVGALIWSVYRWYFAFSRFGPAVVWRWTGPAIAVSSFAFILAVICGLFLIRNSQRQVVTTAEGIWLINGGNRRRLPWSEIASLRSSASRYTWPRSDHNNHLRMSLKTLSGNEITIPPQLTGLEALHALIKERVYPLAMSRYRKSMEAGDPLQFGPLQLTRTAVVYRGRTHPWQSFKDVRLEQGRLSIEFHTKGGLRRISISAWRVPNIDLCVQLLKNIEF